MIQTGTVQIANGFKFMITGKLVAGPLELEGRFAIEVTPGSLKISAKVAAKIGPIGSLEMTADLIIDGDGLALRTTLHIGTGDPNAGFALGDRPDASTPTCCCR